MGSYLERTVVVSPFQCNCRVLVCKQTQQAVIIDPGGDPDKILGVLGNIQQELGKPLKIQAFLHTHGHLDHVSATRDLKNFAPSAQISLHRGDEPLYQKLVEQGSYFNWKLQDPLAVEHYLEDQETIQVGSFQLSVIHTPGHSPGSCTFRLHEDTVIGCPETAFTGDTLFFQSVGRTDLWGGDHDLLLQSIHQRLFTLDDDTLVCPGHGVNTTMGIEKRTNPFFV